MAYNMSFMNTSNNLFDVVSGVNVASGGVVSVFLLFIIFVISYAVTSRNGASEAFMSSSLVTSISAILMWYADLFPWEYLLIPIIMFFISIVYRWFSNR